MTRRGLIENRLFDTEEHGSRKKPSRINLEHAKRIRGCFRLLRGNPRETAARLWRIGAVAVAALVIASPVHGQVKPNAKWHSIRTEHFYVHFTPELEVVARRTAASAETAYVKLSAHLSPPNGAIDLVVADNVDFSNGSATPFPSNRIVIYANPPVDEGALRFTDDPIELVVTHELTHIFHLDRSGGIWRVLRRFFGRVPWYFPNAYQPSWLVEGLAVYYESLLTGSGRLVGTEHRMIARTAAGSRELPRIDQLSLARPHFPYGYSAYAYGSLFVDYLARTHGDSAVRKFVGSSSRLLIPVYLNWPARRAFRTTFTAAYRRWSDSLLLAPSSASPSIAGWRDLTMHGAYAAEPRWISDSRLVYDGTSGRESYGAYRLTLRPDSGLRSPSDSGLRSPVSGLRSVVSRQRLARRHTRSPNSPLPDGSLLYSQLEYSSLYELRSDLYVDRADGGGTRRLTRGARLSLPDARRDGLVVAMQTVPGGTRLAIVSMDGKHITPITTGDSDEQWTEPRWSPDGLHIAAIRWMRGGTSSVVVVDSAGRIEQTVLSERAVNSTPSWSGDGRHVYFSSDRTGIANLYRMEFCAVGADSMGGATPVLERVSDTQTGLFEPQLSLDGRHLVAVMFRADGYHIGLTPTDSLRPVAAERIDSITPREPRRVTSHESPVTSYSPLRSLLPRYWLPFSESALDSNSARLGAYTSGEDLVGRHSYQALFYVPTDNSGITGSFYYRNARLGQPVLDLVASQDRENFLCLLDASQQNRCVGLLRRRIRDASLAFTLNRLRVRSSSYLSLGTGVEARDYSTSPESLLARVDSLYLHTFYFPRVALSMGWSNVQYPLLAISPEDGLSLATTARWRWRRDRPALSVSTIDTQDYKTGAASVVVAASAFKSIPLPGFAHHVVAVRGAAGYVESRNSSYLEVGGISGGTLDLFPGYSLGEGRRTFPVRGFPAAAMIGMRAYSASAEYRAPLALPGRGLGLLPFFLDRASVSFFGDLGTAWCPGIYPSRPAPGYSLCTRGDYDLGRTTLLSSPPAIYLEPYTIGSVGAELNLSAAAWGWDHPFRYRLGIAAPVMGQNLLAGVSARTAYFAVGTSF